jgi:tight adherence protein B
MTSPQAWIPALLAFVAVAFAVLTLALLWEWWRDRQRRREITARIASGKADQSFENLFRDSENAGSQWLNPLADRLPHIRDLQHLLDQAAMGWHVGTFTILTVGIATALGLFGMLLTAYPIIALLGALLGGTMPYVYVRWKKNRRMDAFLENFPDAIDLLGRSIRAGHAFSTGLQMIADEASEPVADEFRRVFEEQKFGLPVDESLYGLADRIDLVEVHIFVTAVLVQREVGGNLAEILDTLAETIRQRFTIERQVRVYTAQGRLTGYLLAVLPIVMGFLIYALNRQYMSILFEEPVGRLLIAVAALMQIMGYFIIRRIVDIKV